MKNSFKWQEFEIVDSKIMTERQIQGKGFWVWKNGEFENNQVWISKGVQHREADEIIKDISYSLVTVPISVFSNTMSLFFILKGGKWFVGSGELPPTVVGMDEKLNTPDWYGELSRTCSSLICTLMD